jgi:hypothetical protein
MTTSDSVLVVSADCHAGAPIQGYRQSLESKWHDEFDAWAASFTNPFSGADEFAERALQLGLVNRVVDDELVVETAVGLATALADRPPATLRRVRHLMTVTAVQSAAASAGAMAELGVSEQLKAEAAAGIGRFVDRPRLS